VRLLHTFSPAQVWGGEQKRVCALPARSPAAYEALPRGITLGPAAQSVRQLCTLTVHDRLSSTQRPAERTHLPLQHRSLRYAACCGIA
jgi:hypothetical protein